MSLKFFLLFVVVLLECQKLCNCGRMKRIVGGVPVGCGEQPRVVSLRNSTTYEHLCGGTIISADFAITVAHCVPYKAEAYILYLINLCIEDKSAYPMASVVDIIMNDLYNKQSGAHDIALLKIELDLNDVSWLHESVLPTSSFGLSGECTIYGNGYQHEDAGTVSQSLEAAQVTIISLDECAAALGPYVAPAPDSGMICALGHHSDACQGDSGGPLMCYELLQGLSSFGMGCGVDVLPGVYTSIGPHLSWIRNVIH